MKVRLVWSAWTALALLGATPAWAEEEEDAVEAVEADEGTVTADAVFDFLSAEVAAQRGDLEGALAVFHRLARELKDAQIARRAVELAFRARAFEPALDGAMLLLEIDGDSSLGREILAALLANEGDLEKAREKLATLLERSRNPAPVLMQLSHVFGKFSDKAAVLEATRKVAARHARLPESRYALGVAALLATRHDEALRQADAALSARPGWEAAAILKAQVLRKTNPGQVIGYYRSFITGHPDAIEVRLQLGRELAGERKLAEAREQFRAVEKLAARDPQAPYGQGLLSLQLEDFADAQSSFTRALKAGYRDAAAIYLGLGQAAEGLKRYEEAIGWYQKVESGDWFRAQLKIATLIARQQGLPAGREYLARVEPRTPEDRVQVVQVEAQLLRDAKAWQETFDHLSAAVKRHPDSYELLYDRAMAAERVDKLDVLEADLRRVIEMKPDYAHAYNALGYTLAEKTDRLAEARELIERAHRLAPDDPFILDSLGWVNYRQGRVAEALKYLHAAYGARPDPEIAAHLGEVLWKNGQHDEANTIWRNALSENPNHETLLAVMQKFQR